MARKSKLSQNKNIGIILLIVVLFQLINIPLIDEKSISLLIIVGVAIYLLIK